MTIERIDQTDRMSRIVKHNGTVYLCGQVGDTRTADVSVQTQEICAKIDTLLEQAGSSRENMLSVTIYLRDIDRDFKPMNDVYDAWVADVGKPARACVEAHMASPELLVEFSVVASY